EILIDCDDDTVLLKVDQIGGAACHTGYETCFYRKLDEERVEIVAEKIFDPKEVYGK
ncbi:MAG TPA: phosphoribosyl-AMP cyclohydrolase, partial [Deltaproteobacteria bacterium]|nr:phosphoribosyl-AMP cyclohydrolase [Deltaproteobacteria bacterium]